MVENSDDELADDDDHEHKPLGWKTIAAAAVLLLLFGVVLFGGIRGCASESAQDAAKREEQEKKEAKEKEKKEKEKQQQEDPKVSFPAVLPNESSIVDQFVKPGHWAVASQQMEARERDFIGRTQTDVEENTVVIPIPNTPFRLQSTRPAALAKGTKKFVDSTFFVPVGSEKIWLSTSFDEGGLGYPRERRTQLQPMLPHQYHFVVLAKEPDRYALIKTLDSVKTPYNGEPGGEDFMRWDRPEDRQYVVDLLPLERDVPLPDNPLMWTSIAYVLWDEVDPEPFTPEQEAALIDWLHWGGQLIINGPDSLDLLKGSFLEPYLPAKSGGPHEIATSDLRTFSDNWMISTRLNPGRPLEPVAPWSGITLVPAAASDKTLFELTGGLLIERKVGRGRIVVSAMQLSERELVNWKSGFESWFNACLLRRPPRRYFQVSDGNASLLWDASAEPSLKDRRLDARLNTRLRYFIRDEGVDTSYHFVRPADGSLGNAGMTVYGGRGLPPNYGGNVPPTGPAEYQPPANAGGIGAWNDFNATASAARGALREAAGVDVPNRAFVVGCLAAYLFVLVPVNWAVFRMLGRVEWAWIAAPLIAIAGTYVVVQRAQLDIGFVRSQTEIGILELQPDHPRAHLARYTATLHVAFDHL